MRSPILLIVFYFGTSTLSQQRNGPAFEIDELLDYLINRESSVKNADVFNKIPYQSEQINEPDGNVEDSRNLIEIQSPNHRFKNNARDKQQFEDRLEQGLREESDKICRETGICGCKGGRCGSRFKSDDATVSDVERLLKEIENVLNRDDSVDKHDILDNHNDDLDKGDVEPNVKRIDNKFQDDNNLKIVFLEESDLHDKNVIDKLHNLADDVKIVDLRNVNLENVLQRPKRLRSKHTLKPSDGITPEDFNNYYEKGKATILRDLTDIVKAKKHGTHRNQLAAHQKILLDLMKKRHSLVPMSDHEIRRDITDIVFGTYSGIRVLPQSKDSNVHVPRHLFMELQKFKNNDELRAKKSVLPLTSQQKSRKKVMVNNKFQPTFAWRRNMRPRDTYGVAFDLDVQGLGQLN